MVLSLALTSAYAREYSCKATFLHSDNVYKGKINANSASEAERLIKNALNDQLSDSRDKVYIVSCSSKLLD